MMALEHLAAALRSLRAARTSLKSALQSRGLNETAELWEAWHRIDRDVVVLARQLRNARLARLTRRAA